MSEQKPNWVELVADCNIHTVFENLIKAVEKGAKAMSDLPWEKRGYVKYACNKQGGSLAFIFHTNESGRRILSDENPDQTNQVVLVKDAAERRIQIHLNSTGQPIYRDFAPRWNVEKQVCELVLDGNADRSLEVWQVSQEALVPLFSGALIDTA